MSMVSRSSFLIAALAPALAFAQPEPAPPTEPAPAPLEPVQAKDPAPAVVAPPPGQEAPKEEHEKAEHEKAEHKKADKPWYERFTIRGYMQARFNRIYSTDDDFKNDLGDKNIAKNNSFSLRRARFVLTGDVAPFLAIYLQTEASGADVKMRDWYGDIFLDKDKEFRIRVGQSKVPFGFENMQSSQNRAPLDRSDPINSGAPGERDLGAFAYWAPKHTRKVFKHLVDDGLKGSGDYGVLALGIYNGQGINVDDKNENRHVVLRGTYPLELGDQILEVGANGYLGKFTIERDAGIAGKANIRDMRVGGHVVLYPQPIGFQAEYNVGKGPELTGDTVADVNLQGGYAMVIGHVGDFFPFVRGAYYDGALKTEKNAPHHETKELVIGSEWHFHKRIELTLEVDHARRKIADDEVRGTIVRGQLQLNY